MQRGRRRRQDLTAQRARLLPLAGLAKDDGEAGQAQLRHRLQRVRGAVSGGGFVGLARGPVLAGVLVGICQPLINLGGGAGETALQRERQRGMHKCERRGALTHPRAHISLEPEHARLEVRSLGVNRLRHRVLEHHQRSPEACRGAEMCRRRKSLVGSVGRAPGRRKGRGGVLAGLECVLPASLQLQAPRRHRAEPHRVGPAHRWRGVRSQPHATLAVLR